tara:strand:+ start:971 stop:2836 length:1866 start_codon:yes stop_codon:yes gene_type:complete
MAEQEKEEPMNVISTIVIVFSIITLVVIVGLGFKKLIGRSNTSIFIREYIQKLIGKLLYLLVFVFYFIPIDGLAVTLINKLRGTDYKSWREINNLNKKGIFGSFRRAALLLLMGLGGLGIFFGFTHEGEDWMKWVFVVFVGLTVLGIVSLLGIDKYQESNKKENRFPYTETTRAKTAWLFNESASYLKHIIGAGLILGISAIILYLFSTNVLFTIAGTQMLMITFSIALMSLAYYLLRKNKVVNDTLKKNKVLGNLFYILFIIPCLFHDTVKFIYNQFRHTPKMVYLIFVIELVIVLSYVLFPMIYKFIYTDIKDVKDHKLLLEKELENIRTEKYFIKSSIKKIKRDLKKLSKKMKENNIKEIKGKDYDSSKNEEDLKNYLINLEIIDIETQNNIINKLRVKIPEIRVLETRLENNSVKLKEMEKFKKGNKEVRASILLRKPIYLEKETKIFGKVKEDTESYYQYNHNFAISSWIFLRGNKSFSDEFRNILKFDNNSLKIDNNSSISYNAYNNKLKVTMNNFDYGDGKIGNKKEYIYKNIPLQKWTNIVLNYDSGVLDIFVDSKLVASEKGVLDKINSKEMTVGGNVKGGICNIVYFPNSISKERIDLNYRMLKNKNPPIV